MVATKEFFNDDIVISGMSGRFPECDTIEEFRVKLFSAVDLVRENDSRWPKGYLNTYSKMGFIKDLRNFDASFFGAHPKLAERTDPIVRILLETSVEAVMDAGICPSKIRGSETGVVVAVSSNEAADWWSADPDRVNGYEFLGCTRTMYSNRISFALDLKGPSYTMDAQSCSGLLGVQQAYYMLKTGMTDAVIVAGVNLVLNPHFNIMFKKLKMLSPDGNCKIFDAEANGYARSEAGVAIIMQRASDAKRVYATIAATEANCDGFKEFGCHTESLSSQISLYQDALSKFNINPLDVSFVEAHGYSTVEGDAIELNGISEVFCKRRESGLMVGCVKSNMGHAEPVGGLVSVVKILLSMESGILPPNLHFNHPNPHIPALKDGRLQVVNKLTIWDGKYAAINSFGIGGTNSHLILKQHGKEKKQYEKSVIPRIMVVSGRTEDAVKTILAKTESFQFDNEFCALMYEVFSQHIAHFNQRAFAIYDSKTITELATYAPQETARPVCFVFSGMGSQWAGMCRDLLHLDIFRKTLDICASVLKTVHFDLHALLNSKDNQVFDNVLNSFVGITCIQIAFVNILYEIGIQPDIILGHSVGELACAYADETLTLEQTVLITYWRGKTLLMTELPPGAMAAIGLSSNDVEKRLPSDISIACHNSSDSVTISGPPSSIKQFTKKLSSEGIFAKEVNSSGYAFHSQYIAKAGAAFKSTLEKIIPQPKLRTKRWISTSVPQDLWNTAAAQYSSVGYHLNNLLSPVYFSDALAQVPKTSVVIEIAPHALLQSILKSSLPSSCTHVGLVRRNQASVVNFLTSLGRLYNAGLQPNMASLYPTVSYPVSRKTPMIQSLIEWDHSNKWFLISFMTKPACVRGEVESVVDITESKYRFLTHCIIDNVPTFPVSGYLYLIWETVAKFQLKSMAEVSVVIENFQVLRKCVLNREAPLKFNINILEESGECEIRENEIAVARAQVRITSDIDTEFSQFERGNTYDFDTYLPLKSTDFYFDLYEKGYAYTNEFRVIKYTNNKGEVGTIKWSGNWMTFIEGLLQMHLLRLNKQSHYAINHIQKVVIDPRRQIDSVNGTNTETGLTINVFPDCDVIAGGGVEIRGVKSFLVSVRNKQRKLIIEKYSFISHFSDKMISLDNAIMVCVQIVFENSEINTQIKVGELLLDPSNHSLVDTIQNIIDREPYASAQVTRSISNLENISETYDLIVTSNILCKPGVLGKVLNSMTGTGFLLAIEDFNTAINEPDLDAVNCKLIAKFSTSHETCALIRKTPVWKTPMVVVVKNDNLCFIDGIKMALRKHHIDKRNTMIIFHGKEPTGIIGLLKSIRREPYGTGLRCLFTDDSIHPYKIVDLTYINYLRKGLTFNVFKSGEWGSYRHLPAEENIRIDCEHAFVGVKDVGDFSSLTYIEGRMPYINAPPTDYELCHVYYAAVYPHRDIFQAIGLLPYDEQMDKFSQGSVLGHEYSGRDSNGKRVFGMVGGGALATTVLADRKVMWDVPDQWTLEQASTVPRVYSIAYYALIMRAKLLENESVYINAGIMGLCVACLNVVVGAKAIPFIGFNNRAEKQYLIETFPQLPQSSFINLEESSIEYKLLELTGGTGVDVIFDTLNSHKRNLFVDALAYNGRLLEFEKGTAFNESLGYTAIEKNITFYKISHNTLWVSKSGEEDRIEIQKLVAEGVRTGVVKPLVTTIFTDQQFEEAFRVAQSVKFVGKVVIKIHDEENCRNVITKPKIIKACPSTFMDPNQSYIVTTALSDQGIEMVNWLISRGGKQIVLQSPYKPVTGYQCLNLRRWRNLDVQIVFSNADISTMSGAETLLATASKLGNVGGIFHVAYITCDCSFERSSKNHFELLWKCKVETTKNLDMASRNAPSCSSLKYFVGFSDISSSFGCSNKSIMAYSCSAMEIIFEDRNNNGLPAIVIQEGVLDKFDTSLKSTSDEQGFSPIRFAQIVNMLPELLNQSTTTLSVYCIKSKASLNNQLQLETINNVADILGIRSIDKLYTSTFEEIGVEPLVLSEIESFLKSKGLEVGKSDIKKLSLKQISKFL